MNDIDRAELIDAIATAETYLDALREESIRLNSAIHVIAADSCESIILCAQADGVAAAQQRMFEAWNAMRAGLRNEQDL